MIIFKKYFKFRFFHTVLRCLDLFRAQLLKSIFDKSIKRLSKNNFSLFKLKHLDLEKKDYLNSN